MGAGVALVAVLAYPLPRNVGSVDAVVRTEVVGGRPGVRGSVVGPAGAADGATAFAVTSWQGGGRVTAFFDEVGPGLYRSEKAVPVTGDWKTVVSLQRGSEVMAAPVYLPADPSIGAEAVPLVPERAGPFVRNTTLLLREQHPGPTGRRWRCGWGLCRDVDLDRADGGDGDACPAWRWGLPERLGEVGRTTDWSTLRSGDHWLPTAARLFRPSPRSCGAAWSARRPVKAEVASSNLVRTAPHGRVAQ